MPPDVSVVMPAFNSAPFVAIAISSVQAQTYANFELIVVDDGSTDTTTDIAQRFAKADPRIRLIRQEHRGVSRARNAAMAAGRGRFFALLDSDDEYMPDFLQSNLQILETHPDIAIVTSNAVNRGGRFDGQPYWSVRDGLRSLSKLDMIERTGCVCVMALFRRTVVDAIGEFDERWSGIEDFDFWMRAVRAGFVIVQNGRPHGYYRRRADGLSAQEHEMLRQLVLIFEQFRRSASEPTELAAIERQIRRFDRDHLMFEAKTSLRARQFSMAAEQFRLLRVRHGGVTAGILATVSRHLPELLFQFDAIRRSCRRIPITRAGTS